MTIQSPRKKILFLTGTRADFGKLKPLIERFKDVEDFEYAIFATGMHLLGRYGATVNEIVQAGFDKTFSYINQDAAVNTQMDLVLANTISGLGHYVREFRPDLVIIHGDRVETLAGAIVGALNGVLVAHVEGGEVSGTVDELIRHAVTKLSHVHFVANVQARERLVQMGEAEESIFVIGSPDIDVMLSDSLPSLESVLQRYEIPFSNYAICMYHPVVTELSTIRKNAEAVFNAIQGADLNGVVIYPNNDHGADMVLQAMEPLRANPKMRIIPSMRFEYFLTLLKNATAIVGNSSAGVREAPVYGVPTVNVGTRQLNRFQYPSIMNVPENEAAIIAALQNLPQSVAPTMHFGSGDSARLFLETLRLPEFWDTPRQKHFRDLPTGWVRQSDTITPHQSSETQHAFAEITR